ncbi:MAG TPA: hypothetical protein VGN05_01825 [Parvibaculum sp.]|jgi:hypothetical protein
MRRKTKFAASALLAIIGLSMAGCIVAPGYYDGHRGHGYGHGGYHDHGYWR